MFTIHVLLLAVLLHLQCPIVSSNRYEILPPLYEMEDFIACSKTNNRYCKADIRLRNNGNENNFLWKLINDSAMDKYSYDRSIIHRAMCIPRKIASKLETTEKFVELRINEQLNGTNLLPFVEDIICFTDYNITPYDILLLFSFVAYLSLILYATMCDRRKRKHGYKAGSNKERILISFSLISNWEKLCTVERDDDYNKLRSIQGIRFYNMLLIIVIHSLLSFSFIYTSTPDIIEKFCNTPVMHSIVTVHFVFVQTFLLISAWIVTFQIYNIYKEQGRFTLQQAFILIINRFFRIGICLTVIILIMRSSLAKLMNGPLTFEIFYIADRACKHNWWQTFLLVNNHLYFGDTCSATSWYLSVDFQLYVMAVITIYLILKFKLEEWKIISFLIILSCTLYGSIIYVNDMDILHRMYPNRQRKYISLYAPTGRILYTSTYSNWTTSIIGISLGIVYTKNKNKNRNIFNNKVGYFLWLLIFFGLPATVALTASREYRGISAAIVGAIIKPLFSLGVGIGILGMSHNMGGIIKLICDNKFVVVMSNFSYCIYLFQLFVLFGKGVGAYTLMEFGEMTLIKYMLFFDIPATVALGIITTLIFEQPGINLQKTFLPQIPRGKLESQKD